MSKKKYIWFFGILGVLVICLSGYYIYRTVVNTNNNQETIQPFFSKEEAVDLPVDRKEAIEKTVTQILQKKAARKDPERKKKLLTAMKNSALMNEIMNVDSSDKEMALAYLKVLSEWFLKNEPPTEEERKKILSQIDEITSIFEKFCREQLNFISEDELEENIQNLRTEMMNHYQDELDPILKKPISEKEMQSIVNKLNKELDRCQAEFQDMGVIKENSPAAKEMVENIKLSRIFMEIRNWYEEIFQLSPSKEMIKLEMKRMAGWHSRVQKEQIREIREKQRERDAKDRFISEFFADASQGNNVNSDHNSHQLNNKLSSVEKSEQKPVNSNQTIQPNLNRLPKDYENAMIQIPFDSDLPEEFYDRSEPNSPDKMDYEKMVNYYKRMLLEELKAEDGLDNQERHEIEELEKMSEKVKSDLERMKKPGSYWLEPVPDEDEL